MSGPKIIDVEATRFAERKRIALLLTRLEAACAAYGAAKGGAGGSSTVDGAILEQLKRSSDDAETVFELMAIRDQTERQLEFAKGEIVRTRRLAIDVAAQQCAAASQIDASIERLREATTDVGALSKLEEAARTGDAREKLRAYEAVVADLQDGDPAIDLEWVREWLSDIDVDDGEPIELPDGHKERWRLEVERIRVESSQLGILDEVQASLERVEAERDSLKRARLLDTLRYPLAEKLREARLAAQREEQIVEWRATVAAHADILDAAEWEERLASEGFSVGECERALEEAVEAAATKEARREVLGSLVELGYELRPGMESAFVVDGKIVLKKSTDRDYGVELSALSHGGDRTLRTRVVRVQGNEAATADERLRDREREESWCADRARMEELLEERGVECEVKAARDAGATAVPVVVSGEGEAPADERRESTSGGGQTMEQG